VYINLRMIEQGHAWYYKTYAPSDTDLAAAETVARTSAAGLWDSDEPPVAPWDYRHNKK
ncbi:MAG: hypothetical protein EOM62_17545, partial [Bacteroidia bacterium]|nr:hypothetical protein [Bacteroidia bacterium]